MTQQPSVENDYLAAHVRLLRDSYLSLTGRELLEPPLDDDVAVAKQIYYAPFALLSHDTSPDPRFNYANRTALGLFEMTWDELIGLPSRKSAETPDRSERARQLEMVRSRGFIERYAGVRISKPGHRFLILQAVVWNLNDPTGIYRGQAASFAHWKRL